MFTGLINAHNVATAFLRSRDLEHIKTETRQGSMGAANQAQIINIL